MESPSLSVTTKPRLNLPFQVECTVLLEGPAAGRVDDGLEQQVAVLVEGFQLGAIGGATGAERLLELDVVTQLGLQGREVKAVGTDSVGAAGADLAEALAISSPWWPPVISMPPMLKSLLSAPGQLLLPSAEITILSKPVLNEDSDDSRLGLELPLVMMMVSTTSPFR